MHSTPPSGVRSAGHARKIRSGLEPLWKRFARAIPNGVVGPRDRESVTDPAPLETDFHVIAHDKLRLGDLRGIDPLLARRLVARFGQVTEPGAQFRASRAIPYEDRDHTDTLDDPRGRWLGGFYPVGETGYVVAVQTAYGAATRALHPGQSLLYLKVAFVLYGVVAVGASLRRGKRS